MREPCRPHPPALSSAVRAQSSENWSLSSAQALSHTSAVAWALPCSLCFLSSTQHSFTEYRVLVSLGISKQKTC